MKVSEQGHAPALLARGRTHGGHWKEVFLAAEPVWALWRDEEGFSVYCDVIYEVMLC